MFPLLSPWTFEDVVPPLSKSSEKISPFTKGRRHYVNVQDGLILVIAQDQNSGESCDVPWLLAQVVSILSWFTLAYPPGLGREWRRACDMGVLLNEYRVILESQKQNRNKILLIH